MKISSKLFEKSIDLKNTHIFGGREPKTEKECHEYEYPNGPNGCAEVTIYYYTDKDEYITHISYTDCD